MTLIKLPAHKAGLFISHNEHRNYYESIADYLGRDYVGDFESPESRARCIATDELWENTKMSRAVGVGSNVLFASFFSL